MKKDYTKILLSKYSGSIWTLDGDDYEGLTWLSDSPKPTKDELDALWPSVELELIEEKEQQESKKNAAIAKLEVLGLTVDDLKALGLA